MPRKKGLILAKSNEHQYIYIVQSSKETTKCKIGKTNDLERRLKEYNNMTGKSKETVYEYLLTCEVTDMATVENDVKYKFITLREEKSKEIYFFNAHWFHEYVKFIKSHPLFVKETFIKIEDKKQVVTKIVKKTTPTLKERGITRKELLQKAQKKGKKLGDEFYTRYEDIEEELKMYDKSIWKDKVVFCNCDDAVGKDETKTSAFALYFIHKFKELGLKKLICTHYGNVQQDLFDQGTRGYVFTKKGYKEIGEYDYRENEKPKYDGSFDHPYSIKLLNEEADIVCTNPPFSRSIDYWNLLINSKKKFIIISNIANPITKAFIHYFKDKKVWAGYNEIDWFLTPKRELTRAAGYWYTNIKIKNRPRYKQLKIIPLKEIPDKYKVIDDNKMLLVDNGYIPSDYKKEFAVSARTILNGILEKGYEIIEKNYAYVPQLKGNEKFRRVIIKKRAEK